MAKAKQIVVVWGLAALLVTLHPGFKSRRRRFYLNYSWRALGLSNIMLQGHGIIVTTMEQAYTLNISSDVVTPFSP